MSRVDEARAHEIIAEGHRKLAEALRSGGDERARVEHATASDWVDPKDSPLGKRRTMALARAGQIDSCKIGRRVLICRLSLEALLERGRRGEASHDEDLFGGAS